MPIKLAKCVFSGRDIQPFFRCPDFFHYPTVPACSDQNGDQTSPLDFRPAFRNKPALGYIFAYGAHNFELFAYRGWLFAYLIFASNHFRVEVGATALSSLMSVFAIIGMSASIIGASICLKYGRAKTIARFGALSAMTAILFGLSGFMNFYLVLGMALLFNITIMLDSASLTLVQYPKPANMTGARCWQYIPLSALAGQHWGPRPLVLCWTRLAARQICMAGPLP